MFFRHVSLKNVFMMSLRCLLDMRVVWLYILVRHILVAYSERFCWKI